MALRLRIVSDQRRVLGEHSTVEFGAPGGTIGRSADNDWVLPDPHRYISAHHARVQCRPDGYFIEDLSTNGVYVNDGDRPLSKLGPYRLQNGDLLRFGDYQVSVAIESGTGVIQPLADEPMPTSIDTLKNVARAAQTDIGASLNLDELLVTDPQTNSDNFRLVNAFGQAVNAPKPASEEPDDEAVARRIARLAKAAARSQSLRETHSPRAGGAVNPAALYDVQSGLQAFCRGAGVAMERLPADAQTRLLHLAGQLFREALLGLKDLERSQQEVRNRLRIELPVSEDSRPSLARSSIEEVLVDIFCQHESRRLDAVQWLRETIDLNKQHGAASASAMRDAFVDFIGRLNPVELEQRFQRAGRRNMLPGSSTTRNWELFSEFYKNLCEMPADSLPHTFVEAFANAYKKMLEEQPEEA